MASDSSSSTPMTLTPDSTGLPDPPTTPTSIKKARRQTAFYPNVNSSNKPQKPFSRSAAKRESVMALGSIEHLQHYFTKTGIAAKQTSLNKPRRGLVPAIGGPSHVKTNSSLSGLPAFQLPPSPALPPTNRPAFPPTVKTYETNPESLLPGVVEDLTAVVRAWHIDGEQPLREHHTHHPQPLGVQDQKPSNGSFDVLGTLKTTTIAIRSIRNYVVSLPDESSSSLKGQFRSKSTSSSSPVPKRLVSQPNSPSDPLTLIRRSALEVLTVLRELEESSRVPLSDDAYDAQSDHGSSQELSLHSRVVSPNGVLDEHEQELEDVHGVDPDTSVTFSLVQVQGRSESVPVWEEEEEDHLSDEEREKREHWDERLVLGSGWLYKQDIKLEDLTKEQEVVKRYLDVVDDVLFGGVRDGRRGWERERERVARKEKAERDGRAKGRRVSAGDGEGHPAQFMADSVRESRRVVSMGMLDAMSLAEEPEEMETVSEEDVVEDDELPEWAKRNSFVDNPLGRAHALLTHVLPVDLLDALPAPSDRPSFLHTLSSGQLLCAAYNTGVRRSRKPWGYISKDAVHDIIALEEAQSAAGVDREKDEKGRKGWTFRRTDNLRLWAAALKLRYLLPIIAPPVSTPSGSTPLTSPSPSSMRFPSSEPPIFFDAQVVARKDEGWESMLQTAVLRWVDAVVEERRGDR